MGKTHQI